jgi:hypothetical protein
MDITAKITLKFQGREIELTQEEARALYAKLGELFGAAPFPPNYPATIEISPAPQVGWPLPPKVGWPPPDIICSSG